MKNSNGFVSDEDTEQFLRTLVEKSTDGIMVIDAQGVIRFANPAAKELFGDMVAELEGYHFGTVAIQENVEITLPSGSQQRTIEMRATDITWQGETAQLAMLRDITDRKEVEQALKYSETKFRKLFENAINGFALTEIVRDPKGLPNFVFMEVNAAFEELIGIEEKKVIGKSATDVFPGIEDTKLGEAFYHIAQTGEANRLEYYDESMDKYFMISIYSPLPDQVATIFNDISERKRAEEELRKSERQFRLLFEHDVHGFALNEVVTDESGEPTDFIFLEVNRAYEEFLGIDREALIGKPALEVLPELRGSRAFEALKQVHKTGKSKRLEYYFEPFDSYLMLSIYQPLPGQIATIFNDITERKRAEEELRKNERQFRQLFENDINGFALAEVVTDQAGEIQNFIFREVNQAFEEILGLDREAILGKQAEEISAVFGDTALREIASEVFRTGEPERFDYFSKSYDKFFNFSVYRPLPNQVAVIFNDITESKQAEEALRKSEEKYRSLYETMALGALYVTEDFDIHTVNPAAQEIFGMEAEEITARKYTDPAWDPIDLDGEPLPQKSRPATRALQTGKRVENFVYGVYNPEKEKHVWVNVSVVPQFRDGEKTPYRAFSTFLDATERIEAERELRRSEQKFRTLFAEMAQGVVYQNAKGEIISANSMAERILGLSHDQLLGKESTDEDWQAVRRNGEPLPGEQHPGMVALRTGERVEDFVFGIQNPKREGTVWINVSAVPLFREGEEEPFQVFTTFLEITDLVEAEHRLRRSEEKFRLLFETMSQGVVIQNRAGEITSANPAAARILEISREELIGMSSMDEYWQTVRMNGEPLPGSQQPAMVALREGRRIEDFNLGLYGGREMDNRWLSVGAVPQFRKGEEEPYQVYTVFLDITDRIRVQQTLEERLKELRCIANISTAIQNDPSIPEICQVAAKELVSAMHYPEIARAVVDLAGQNSKQNGFSNGGKNSLVVPIQLHGEQIGRIRVCYEDDREFLLPEEKNLLESVSERLASYYDRLQAQEALKESEERFRTAIMEAPNPLAIYAEDGEIITLNNAWMEISGYGTKEIPTVSAWLEKAYGEEAAAVKEKVDRLFEVQEPVDEGEQRIRTKDGDERVWYFRSAPLGRLPDGRRTVISMTMDITEQVQAEDELTASEERFRTAIFNAPYPIMIHAEDGEVLTVNDAWTEGSGYSAEELQTLEDWTQKAFRDRGDEVMAMIRNKYASKTQQDEEEMTIITDQGEHRIWQFTTEPLGITPDGRDTAITMAQDITERERYYDRIMALREIDQVISATLDLDEVLDRVTREMQHVMHYDSMSVMLVENETLEVIAAQGFEDLSKIIGLKFPNEPDYPNYKVIVGLQPVSSDMITRDFPKFTQPLDEKSISNKVKSWLGVPLIVQDKAIGMFAIDRHDVNEFTDEDIQIALQFANRAAIAIDNARLYERTRRQLEQLEILRKVDSLITSSLTLDEALPMLLNQIQKGLGVDAAAVFLFDEERDTLQIESWLGFRETPETDNLIKLGHGNTGKVAATRKSLSIKEVTYRSDLSDFPIDWEKEEITSFFACPMLTKGNLVGVLELFHRSRLDPDEDWEDFAKTLCRQAAIVVENITLFNNLEEANEDLLKAYDKTIEGWAKALELRDQETEGHSQRVVALSLKVAKRFGFKEKEMPDLRRGILLHDIGKMGIPDAILRKPGPLTPEEWVIMRRHPLFAYNMLKDIDYLEPALKIPHYHHERWDGSGYPEGLVGEEIPLEARIFMVVDIWDALTSDRPYREAWSEEKTIEYLKEQAGKELDPEVVKVFLEIIHEDRK